MIFLVQNAIGSLFLGGVVFHVFLVFVAYVGKAKGNAAAVGLMEITNG